MARPIVSERTKATIDDMIEASREFAHILGLIRDRFAPVDLELAHMADQLRDKFDAFARAALAGQVADPLTLNTLSRVYEDAAVLVHELAEANRLAARDSIATVSGLTFLCASLVENGSRSIFKA